jgi:hypothetical protein
MCTTRRAQGEAPESVLKLVKSGLSMLSPYCQLYINAYNIQYIVGAMAVPRPVLGFQDTLTASPLHGHGRSETINLQLTSETLVPRMTDKRGRLFHNPITSHRRGEWHSPCAWLCYAHKIPLFVETGYNLSLQMDRTKIFVNRF